MPIDIYDIGVIGKVEQILKLPGGINKVFVQCFGKFKINNYNSNKDFFLSMLMNSVILNIKEVKAEWNKKILIIRLYLSFL